MFSPPEAGDNLLESLAHGPSASSPSSPCSHPGSQIPGIPCFPRTSFSPPSNAQPQPALDKELIQTAQGKCRSGCGLKTPGESKHAGTKPLWGLSPPSPSFSLHVPAPDPSLWIAVCEPTSAGSSSIH